MNYQSSDVGAIIANNKVLLIDPGSSNNLRMQLSNAE